MLTRPTPEQNVALARLAFSDDGKVMLAMLREALESTKNTLILAGPETFQRMQGRAEALRECLRLVESAPDVVRKQSASS